MVNLITQINKATGVDRSESSPDLETFLNKKTDYRTKLSNRNYDVSTQIDKIIINTEARLNAVMRQAISAVVDDAQTPVAKGGKMRIDTGFLRSSGVASLNAAPRGIARGEKNRTYTWDGESLNKILAKMIIGDAFYFGWTAHYAKYREAHDGFLESALQKWQSHVDKATAYFKKKDMAP
jgi:hypothetical protein